VRTAFIVAFAGLVHNAQSDFSRARAIHGVHHGAIEGKSALTAAGNKDAKGFFPVCGGAMAKNFGTNRISGSGRLLAPNFLRSDGIARGDFARKAR